MLNLFQLTILRLELEKIIVPLPVLTLVLGIACRGGWGPIQGGQMDQIGNCPHKYLSSKL